MFLVLEGRTPCLLCGYRIRALLMDTFRINKRSLRKTGKGPSMGWVERSCPECQTPNHHVPPAETYRLTPRDQLKVDAYRANKFGAAA